MYARFGQELYPHETLAAAAVLACAQAENEYLEPGLLTGRIALLLPEGTPAHRQRVAVKLLQRLSAGAHQNKAVPIDTHGEQRAEAGNTQADNKTAGAAGGKERHIPAQTRENQSRTLRSEQDSGAFVQLLAYLGDTQARQDLVYYGAARADALIGAIARDILYPYFIENRIPPPFGEDEFLVANAGLLLAPEPILTTGVVADIARRAWQFDSERTVTLALRVLRQAGILLSAPILGERGRVAAFTLAPHGLSLAALLWGLHHEYGHADDAPTWDQVCRSDFARLYVVPPSVIASRLMEAERAGLVAFWSAGGTRRVALKVRETDALARLLLSGRRAK